MSRGAPHLARAAGLAAALAAAVAASACGYRTLRGDRPGGAARIAVRPFAEPGADGLAPQLAQQLDLALAAGGAQLTAREADADAVLDGRLELRTLPSATRAGVLTYQLGARALVTLRAGAGAELAACEVEAVEDYLPAPPGAQPQRTEAHRRAALARLAERLADGIATQLALQGA